MPPMVPVFRGSLTPAVTYARVNATQDTKRKLDVPKVCTCGLQRYHSLLHSFTILRSIWMQVAARAAPRPSIGVGAPRASPCQSGRPGPRPQPRTTGCPAFPTSPLDRKAGSLRIPALARTPRDGVSLGGVAGVEALLLPLLPAACFDPPPPQPHPSPCTSQR